MNEGEESDSIATITVVGSGGGGGGDKSNGKVENIVHTFHLYAAMIRRTSVTMGYSLNTHIYVCVCVYI